MVVLFSLCTTPYKSSQGGGLGLDDLHSWLTDYVGEQVSVHNEGYCTFNCNVNKGLFYSLG